MASIKQWPEWLERIWWRDASLTMEAVESAVLPPYFGSTLRGALGHVLRTALCDGSGCGHECQQPQGCRYFSLFERNQRGAKPLLLLTPPAPGLEQVALGGPVNLPYRTGPPRENERIPTLRCEAGWQFDAGQALNFRFRPSCAQLRSTGSKFRVDVFGWFPPAKHAAESFTTDDWRRYRCKCPRRSA